MKPPIGPEQAQRLRAMRAALGAWSLRRRVAVTFAAFALVFTLITLTIVVSFGQAVHRGNDVINRWGPATLRTESLVTDMVNQETGVRGYALSSRLESLQPYSLALPKEQLDAAAVRTYLTGKDHLLVLLNRFQASVGVWQVQTAQPLIQLVGAGDPRAVVRVDSLADKARFDDIRARAADLATGVHDQLVHAQNARRSALRALTAALCVTALVILAGAYTVWRGLHRWVLTPVDRLARQARDVATNRPQARITGGGPPEFAALAADVEWMRQQAARALSRAEATSVELARSNADLEQFAYVASHDLSEPLRKIANFCQLLERQYGDQLDERAKQYIDFAVDGARRMQTLISDLLALSRVGRSTDSFAPVDTASALQEALEHLEDVIEATGAGVGHSDLPTVFGDRALIVSLLENLIGNSIKYRSDEPPLVVVTAVPDSEVDGWLFTVQDNGIGIEAQYADRIFAIFQRLHLRESYAGTGIGLALCRKIVQFHDGRIWLDTEERRPGATFRFTLPGRPRHDA
ncbi:MAG TPA: ATP-binding protein [Jatrophihabitantaceae bacterium]|nr:ATP-binding protein [Jatrophihabitantaceae bacterium]